MTIDLYGFGPALAAGALMTVKLALAALCLGLVLGLLGALAKTSPYKPLKWLGGRVRNCRQKKPRTSYWGEKFGVQVLDHWGVVQLSANT